MPNQSLAYFDKHAQEYAMMQKQVLSGSDMLLQVIGSTQLDPTSTVLDLGCGPGRLAAELAPSCSYVVAIDIAPDMISLARKQSDAAGYTNVDFLVADADHLPFAPHSFDLVVSRSVLQYADLKQVLPSLRRLSRQGGEVLITHMSITSRGLVPRARALLYRIWVTSLPATWRIAKQGDIFQALRFLRARLRHAWFAVRLDTLRQDIDTAVAQYKKHLPGCDVWTSGRFIRVRWPGQGIANSETDFIFLESDRPCLG